MNLTKNTVAVIGIGALVTFQIGAWYFGKNGTVTSICTAGIIALVGIITGSEILVKRIEKK